MPDIDYDDPDVFARIERALRRSKPLRPERIPKPPLLPLRLALRDIGVELLQMRPPTGWWWGRRR